jgi:hypothetical protein
LAYYQVHIRRPLSTLPNPPTSLCDSKMYSWALSHTLQASLTVFYLIGLRLSTSHLPLQVPMSRSMGIRAGKLTHGSGYLVSMGHHGSEYGYSGHKYPSQVLVISLSHEIYIFCDIINKIWKKYEKISGDFVEVFIYLY